MPVLGIMLLPSYQTCAPPHMCVRCVPHCMHHEFVLIINHHDPAAVLRTMLRTRPALFPCCDVPSSRQPQIDGSVNPDYTTLLKHEDGSLHLLIHFESPNPASIYHAQCVTHPNLYRMVVIILTYGHKAVTCGHTPITPRTCMLSNKTIHGTSQSHINCQFNPPIMLML